MIEIYPRQVCIIKNCSYPPSLDAFIKIEKTLDVDVNALFDIEHKELNRFRVDIINLVKTVVVI